MKRKFKRFFTNNYVCLITDVILLLSSGYLMLKKVYGFSISAWLFKSFLQESLVSIYQFSAFTILIICILVKVCIIYCSYFPHKNHDSIDPDEISDCLYKMNEEIVSHLTKCDTMDSVNVSEICEQHNFSLNLTLITETLAEHIKKSIKNFTIKKKNLFISLYEYNCDKDSLDYLLHFDPKRDLIVNKIIPLKNSKFNKYESIKCWNSTNSTAYVLNGKKDYIKGGSKRYKTIKHYLGFKIMAKNEKCAFLNIEFHHEQVFVDEDEMQEFMEEHIYPFKLLYEYQYLKNKFFKKLKEFENTRRVQ